MPTCEEFTSQLTRWEKAADIRAPEWGKTQRVIDADGDLSLQCLPGRIGIPGPDPTTPSSHAEMAVPMKAPRA
jgi:hypothetical protein